MLRRSAGNRGRWSWDRRSRRCGLTAAYPFGPGEWLQRLPPGQRSRCILYKKQQVAGWRLVTTGCGVHKAERGGVAGWLAGGRGWGGTGYQLHSYCCARFKSKRFGGLQGPSIEMRTKRDRHRDRQKPDALTRMADGMRTVSGGPARPRRCALSRPLAMRTAGVAGRGRQ